MPTVANTKFDAFEAELRALCRKHKVIEDCTKGES